MHKLRCLHLSAAVLAFTALVGMEARSAELEGALQYPPRSVGQDSQPPPPAKTVPQLVSPRRIELGISGSSVPPGTQLFLRCPPILEMRWTHGAPPRNAGVQGGTESSNLLCSSGESTNSRSRRDQRYLAAS
jgi:hypothetical protein